VQTHGSAPNTARSNPAAGARRFNSRVSSTGGQVKLLFSRLTCTGHTESKSVSVYGEERTDE